MFVHDGNKRRVVESTAEATSMRVLLIAPTSLTQDERSALEKALTSIGAEVHSFVTDEKYDFGEVRKIIPKMTHILMLLDRGEQQQASQVLLSADAAGWAKIGFVCLHTDQSLNHFSSRIFDMAVELIVVRDYAGHARVRTKYGRHTHHMMVADQRDLAKSAMDIAKGFVGVSRHEAIAAK